MLDNLNTHNPAAFYEFLPPTKARAYLDRFAFRVLLHAKAQQLAEYG